MIHIDGSRGEGGGQVLRSSLALSLVTGQPFIIENIRANREKPGLMRQHLTAVEAAATVGGCSVGGVGVGAKTLRFEPGKVRGGNYVFRIGTAGSATLVLQTVLPALMLAEEPSTVMLSGGTHNSMAPPFDFLQRVFLPMVNRLGPTIEAKLLRHGFYPAGGGEFRVDICPVPKLTGLCLTQRGETLSRSGRILISRIPEHVAHRERKTLAGRMNWAESEIVIEEIRNSAGPGNVVMLSLESEHVTELFTAFGSRGVRAEEVAAQAAEMFQEYAVRDAPVGEFLADQLLLPLGIAAWQGSEYSEFLTGPLSPHATTHIDILRRFLDIDIQAEDRGGRVLVRIGN